MKSGMTGWDGPGTGSDQVKYLKRKGKSSKKGGFFVLDRPF